MNVAAILSWKIRDAYHAARCETVDGEITYWDHEAAGRAEPTRAEIAAWATEYQLVADDVEAEKQISTGPRVATFAEVALDLENRVRVLEGRQPVSRADFIAGLATIYRGQA